MIERYVTRSNRPRRRDRNVTNRQMIAALLAEWHPSWLADHEIVLLCWRPIPAFERQRIYRAMETDGVIRRERKHGIDRIYWNGHDR